MKRTLCLFLIAASACLPAFGKLDLSELADLRLPDVQITSAVQVEAKQDSAAHVKVDGVIGKSIHFELLLPDEWNERFVMGGGGGFVGSVQNGARYSVNWGYATVGTDTGHQGVGHTAGWALDNMEAQVNFGHVAVHRTAEVAKAIIRAYYGADAEFSYFLGCSRGGGQALMEAQRYPDDFDGIVSGAPAFNWTGLTTAMVDMAKAMYPDPGNLTESVVDQDTLNRVYEEFMKQCDARDGVEDEIADDPCGCGFDLSKAKGLTDAQRKAIQTIYDGPRNADGQIYPGMPPGGESGQGGWNLWISGPVPGLGGFPSLSYAFGTEFYKYLVFNDPKWDYSKYEFSSWERDTRLIGTLLNATDPNLDAMKARGGKLILWHGWADAALTALATVDYYEQVRARDPEVLDYCRLFMLPGVYHCGGGPGPGIVDWLATIVGWVEGGKAPDRVIAANALKKKEATLTRPVYPYPERAVYKGKGSTDKAKNFVRSEK